MTTLWTRHIGHPGRASALTPVTTTLLTSRSQI
jgi:hypothetical protein